MKKRKKKKLYRKKVLPNGKIFLNLSKDYFIIISGVIFKKELFTRFGFFNENYNIIGDYDFVMKISKFCNAHSTNLPLLNYRVHENNYLKKNTKLFYEEYLDWFDRLKKKNDVYFIQNQHYFKNRLIYLEVISRLKNEKKNFSILIKIMKHKVFYEKMKLLILFFLPKTLLRYL